MSERQPPSPPTLHTPSRPKLICAADIEPHEMQWLWYPYVPIGVACMMFGPGGIGKSHIACDIAARTSTGEALPGQDPRQSRRPQKVLFMTAEDDPKVVLQPRLVSAGADLHNIFIPEESFILDKAGINSMEFYMRECACTVVFIDPIVAYMGGKIDMNKMNEVRTLTMALANAARESGSAVIIVHHSRKGSEGQDFERAAGSADFINSMRSVLYVNKGNDGTRLMRHVKSNYSRLGPTLAYEFGDNDHFRWVGEYDEPDAPVDQHGGKRIQAARSFLSAVLSMGPAPANEVVEMASAEGISKTTLNRAKDGLVKSTLRVDDATKIWYWELI